jgi:hypothetical protein
MALGRISGPLLKANLTRDGIDIAFETDLLYLDVNNLRLGVNTSTPTADIDINGTTHTTNLVVDNQVDVGNLHITGNTISSDLSTITFSPSGAEATIYHSKLQIDSIEITNNRISTIDSNAPLEFRPNGTGTVDIYSNTNITGNLAVTGNINATGDITIGGNITIGDALTDTIQINASIQSDLIPQADNTYDLGSTSFRWKTAYINTVYTDNLSLSTLDVGNLMFRDNEITTTTGQDLYIDGNGSGGVGLGNFRIVDNVITNVSSNAVTIIQQTGTGYFKINTTNGFVPPVGSDAQRPTAYAVIGMTRYNTNSKALEIWDGTAWSSPAGSSGAVSEIQANEIGAAFALMLG